jgi:integrase
MLSVQSTGPLNASPRRGGGRLGSGVQIPAGPPIDTPRTVSVAFSEIATFAFWMAKQGYADTTIRASVKTLKALGKHVNLLEPEIVKGHLTPLQVSETRKQKICEDLARFYKHKQIPFDKPHYRRIEVMPLLPLETEIDQLVSGLGKKSATFVLLLKETGMRLGEAWNLRWIDLDPEECTVRITPEKGSNARTLKISNRLSCMMNSLPRKWRHVFRNSSIARENSLHTFRRHYVEQRRKIAQKVQNPRIEAITFKTMRHWRASTLYFKTKDLLLVKDTLGHKAIASTMKYTHLINQLSEEEYAVKGARNEAEAKPLIEVGFQYTVTTPDGIMLFRRRK